MDGKHDKLDALWAEYRDACPDPEASPQFMPKLWRRIEERRTATTSMFRRLARICVTATVALTIVLGVVLIPLVQDSPVFNISTYVDVLAADSTNTYVDILNGDIKLSSPALPSPCIWDSCSPAVRCWAFLERGSTTRRP